jgi:hypothetical protein
MTRQLRLDADLTFSVSNPPVDGQEGTVVQGTVTADGTHVDITVDRLESLAPGTTMRGSAATARTVAKQLADRGLSVSLNGPEGRVLTLGAVKAPVLQRLATRSPHLRIDNLGQARALLRSRGRVTGGPSLADLLPPGTPWPPAPTFRYRRRRITTTHDPRGGGRPRLVFSVSQAPVVGATRRVYYLARGTTTIGSDPANDLVLEGLQPQHAEVRRRAEDDEYFLHALGGAEPTRVNGAQVDTQVLRTGSRVQLGEWTMSYAREEFADHGRPFGGREGGEFSDQRPQERPTTYR